MYSKKIHFISFSLLDYELVVNLLPKSIAMSKQKTTIDIENELRVKELLAERKILMKDFADMIGIKRETLTRSLKGNPQYSTLKAIADGLGVSVPDLFKTHTATPLIDGFVSVNGDTPIHVGSVADLKKLLADLEKVNAI